MVFDEDVDPESVGPVALRLDYARLHADKALYPDGWYEPSEIDRWAQTIDGWLEAGQDAYVYFDNDSKVRAPIDAMSLIARMGSATRPA
mgnify:CR=1 FL=1